MDASEIIQQDSPYQIPQGAKDGTMLYITNPEDEIRRLELTMKGMYEDSNGKLISYGKPKMNELGIQSIIGMVRSVVSQINIMGQEDKREVNQIMLDYINTLAKVLMTKWQDFGLNREDREMVFLYAKYPPYFALKRALDQGERKFWGKVQQEVKHVVEQNGNNKGVFSKVFGRINNM